MPLLVPSGPHAVLQHISSEAAVLHALHPGGLPSLQRLPLRFHRLQAIEATQPHRCWLRTAAEAAEAAERLLRLLGKPKAVMRPNTPTEMSTGGPVSCCSNPLQDIGAGGPCATVACAVSLCCSTAGMAGEQRRGWPLGAVQRNRRLQQQRKQQQHRGLRQRERKAS